MFPVQSRYAMYLVIVILLLGGLSPLSSFAQTGDDPAFVDSMDGQTQALLSEDSPDPTQFVYRYALGQYTLQALDPAFSGDIFSFINAGPFADSRTAVDAVIDQGAGGERSDQYLFVGCRAGGDHNGYAFRLQPATGNVSLWRLDAEGPSELATEDGSGLVLAAGELNRLEIECAGNAITGILNGEVVASATDDTYASGTSYIGAGTPLEFAGSIFAAFDNLEVFELGATEPEAEGDEAPVDDEPVDEEPGDEESASEVSSDIPAGAVDPAALETAVIDYAVTVGPVAGPFVEDVMLTNGALRVLPAGVQVTNFHTEVRFVVPVDAPPGSWSVGFCYWVDVAGNCYDVFISSDGTTAEWNYARSSPAGDFELFDSGPITGLDLTPGVSNFIGLSVVGGTGVIIVNSPDPAASFAVDAPGGTGDVARWLAFESEDPADTRSFTMSTDEFSVWDLSGLPPVEGTAAEPETAATPEAEEADDVEEPDTTAETDASDDATAAAESEETAEPTATTEPEETVEPTATTEPEETAEPTATEETEASEEGPSTPSAEESTEPSDADNPFSIELGELVAGPLSGQLTETDSTIETFLAGVDIADFYASVEVVVPAEAPEPWDFTIGFRDFGDNEQYRLTIVSDGTWTLAYGDDEPFDSGEVDNLLVAPGEVNTIELVADGDGGEVALNGERFTSIFLTEVLDAGDIWVATAATFETTSPGRTTEFREFQIFEIE